MFCIIETSWVGSEVDRTNVEMNTVGSILIENIERIYYYWATTEVISFSIDGVEIQ